MESIFNILINMDAIINFNAFLIASVLLIITPGVDTVYILTRSVSQGRIAGVMSALGVCSGLLVHTLFATAGLSLILKQSAEAFILLKYVGAGYLIYLGVKSLLQNSASMDFKNTNRPLTKLQVFLSGLLTNVLNPKVALFFLAFLPQFIQVDHPYRFHALSGLGLIFTSMAVIYCIGLALCASTFHKHLKNHSLINSWMSKVTGLIFILIGLRLAFKGRP